MATNLEPLTPREESRPCEMDQPDCLGGAHGRSKGYDQSSYFLGVENASILMVSEKAETQPQGDVPNGHMGVTDG